MKKKVTFWQINWLKGGTLVLPSIQECAEDDAQCALDKGRDLHPATVCCQCSYVALCLDRREAQTAADQEIARQQRSLKNIQRQDVVQ